MSVSGRALAAALVVVAVVGALSACGTDADMNPEEKVVVQEAQLEEFIAQADAWGAQILAQIPVAEVEDVYPNMGGSRGASDYNEHWPRYYYWFQGVDLLADGPRSTTEVADDLEPWLSGQGWKRSTGSEFPPGEESFERDFYRDGYHLIVEVYTEAPPQAQSINFKIVTPETDPDRR